MSAVFLAFGHGSDWARSLLKRKLIPVRVKRKRNRFDAAGSPPFMLTIPRNGASTIRRVAHPKRFGFVALLFPVAVTLGRTAILVPGPRVRLAK
jgi:hypothetical protein